MAGLGSFTRMLSGLKGIGRGDPRWVGLWETGWLVGIIFPP